MLCDTHMFCTVRVVWDALRYFRDISADSKCAEMCALTVGEYLHRKGYCRDYTELVFLPLYR
jgi:hypothetical protein